MSSPVATSVLICRLKEVRSSRGILRTWRSSRIPAGWCTRSRMSASTWSREYIELSLSYENYLEIADVGAGWTCVNEIAERVEKRVGVVVREECLRRQAGRSGPLHRRIVGERASGVGRPVDAVRSDTGDGHWRFGARQRFGDGEDELLITSAFSAPRDPHRRFPARHDAGRPRAASGAGAAT